MPRILLAISLLALPGIAVAQTSTSTPAYFLPTLPPVDNMPICIEDMPAAPADPTGDWGPALNQAMRHHLWGLAPADKTFRNTVLIGCRYREYRSLEPVNVFNSRIRAVNDDVIVRFPQSSGFVFHAPASGGGGGTHSVEGDPFSGRGGTTHALDGLLIIGPGKTATAAYPTASGIVARRPIHIRDTHVQQFPAHGIDLNCGVGRAGSGINDALSNCNEWSAQNVTASFNGGAGFYLDGPDANAGLCTKCSAVLNGIGFWDSSLLGNAFNGAHLANNDSDDILVDDPNARSTFTGLYVEGTGTVCLNARSVVLGVIGGDLETSCNDGNWIEAGTLRGQWAVAPRVQVDGSLIRFFATNEIAPPAFTWMSFERTGSVLRVKHEPTFGMRFDFNNLNSRRYLRLTDDSYPGGSGLVLLPNGLSLGTGELFLLVSPGEPADCSGASAGTIWWNSSASPGDPIGWQTQPDGSCRAF